MDAIAIIPARGGSRRISRKNVRPFHGKPIIAYSIETARKSGLFGRVIVSTDDAEIGKIAEQYGAEVHERSEKYARDEVGTQEVAKNVLMELGIYTGEVCVIYPTSPLLTDEDLKDGHACLSEDVMFAMSVQREPLADAGAFYWGSAEAFYSRAHLISPLTAMVPIPVVCDINTEDDWKRAEKLYEEMKRGN